MQQSEHRKVVSKESRFAKARTVLTSGGVRMTTSTWPCRWYWPEGQASGDPRHSVTLIPFLSFVPYGKCNAGGDGVRNLRMGHENVDVDDGTKAPGRVVNSRLPCG